MAYLTRSRGGGARAAVDGSATAAAALMTKGQTTTAATLPAGKQLWSLTFRGRRPGVQRLKPPKHRHLGANRDEPPGPGRYPRSSTDANCGGGASRRGEASKTASLSASQPHATRWTPPGSSKQARSRSQIQIRPPSPNPLDTTAAGQLSASCDPPPPRPAIPAARHGRSLASRAQIAIPAPLLTLQDGDQHHARRRATPSATSPPLPDEEHSPRRPQPAARAARSR